MTREEAEDSYVRAAPGFGKISAPSERSGDEHAHAADQQDPDRQRPQAALPRMGRAGWAAAKRTGYRLRAWLHLERTVVQRVGAASGRPRPSSFRPPGRGRRGEGGREGGRWWG